MEDFQFLELIKEPIIQEFVFAVLGSLSTFYVLWIFLNKKTSLNKDSIAGIAVAIGLLVSASIIFGIAGLRSKSDILLIIIVITGGYFGGKRQYASAVAARNSKRMKKLREEKRKKKEEEKRLAEEKIKE